MAVVQVEEKRNKRVEVSSKFGFQEFNKEGLLEERDHHGVAGRVGGKG